ERQMRDEILAALSEVPGVIEALSLRFSQIGIGYGDSNTPFAPGTRVNPDTIGADNLAWSLLTPDAASAHLPSRFKVTVSEDVSQPVAVRPGGIVASTELVRELFGFDLIPGPVRSQSAVELAPTFPHHQSQRSELQVRSTINTA
ncbi:MAG TPA: hypothetical protein VGF65_05255, partial [Mycobacterium sp.]